ncbi:MAG: FkbM family methyltransferase [Gammaproteobacteria bacterium]
MFINEISLLCEHGTYPWDTRSLMIAPESAQPPGQARDLRLAALALWGFVRSGAFLSSGKEWRRMFMSAKWLAVGHLGVEEVVLPFEGMRLIARTGDHFVGCRVYMDGHFGRNEFQKALALAREAGFFGGTPPVFVDVGANIGTHTLYALGSGLFSRVLSVEPSAENYAHLCRNLAINGFPTTDAVRAAFSSTAGVGELALSGLNFGDHRVVRGEGDRDAARPVEQIELVDLPRLSQRAQLGPDTRFMFWIDTQGHEYEVLSGVPPAQLSQSVFAIEYWPQLLQRNGTLDALHALVTQTADRIIVLQDGRRLRSTADLDALAKELLRKPGEEGQLDLLFLGSRV